MEFYTYSFEKLEVWQLAREFKKEIYKLSAKHGEIAGDCGEVAGCYARGKVAGCSGEVARNRRVKIWTQ